MFGLLDQIRSALSDGRMDPVNRHGATYQGGFELKGSRVIGAVAHSSGAYRRPPMSVIVMRERQLLGSTRHYEERHNQYHFSIDVGTELTSDDILHDRVAVFALDRVGARYALKISGAMQLSYIREVFGQAAETELLIDFSQEGNSRKYVREGWYNPEAGHTWTKGKSSVVEVPLLEPNGFYSLECLLWPFVVPGAINDQQFAISVGGSLIQRASVRIGHNLVECEVPSDIAASASLVVRFDHPDAARPYDYTQSQDKRELALAFKSLKLLRKAHGHRDRP